MSVAEPEWAVHLAANDDWSTFNCHGDNSIARVLIDRWRSVPQRPLLHFESPGWVTNGQVDELSGRLAGGLLDLGISKGDRVVLNSAAGLEYIAMMLAVLRVGAIAVPTNPSYQREELQRVVRLVQPAAAYATEPKHLRWIQEESSSTILIGAPSELSGLAVADLRYEISPTDPAMIFMTSGTTGDPKGAVLSHGNVLSGVRAVSVAWKWSEEDRLLLPLPLFHVHGLAIGLFSTLLVGGSAVVHSKFMADRVVKDAVEQKATMLFGVPTTYARLMSVDDVAKLKGLRLCVSGSAPLPTSLFDAFHEATGQRLLERYGMTETMLTLSNPYFGRRKAGTVGLPLPCVETRVQTLEQVGDAGELLVRGPSVFSGYWERPDLTQQAYEGEWLRTGDLVRRDDEGYFRIVGRLKELIITGGMNVHPGEVEDALRRHDRVKDVAVVGFPSELWGEEVVAFVVANGDLAEEELVGIATAHLAPYKRPKRYLFVEAIPVNAMGKIDRTSLRDWVQRYGE